MCLIMIHILVRSIGRDSQKSGIHLALPVWTYWSVIQGHGVSGSVCAEQCTCMQRQEVLKVRKADYGSSNLSMACEIRGRGEVYPGLDAGYSSHSGQSHRRWWELTHAQSP
jgi:hypothetical protein